MATVSSQTFGDLLRRYRLVAGLTQEELAAQAGLSVRGLSDLERGARRAPRRETVQLLAEALHLSAAERTRLEAAARQRGVPAVQASGESMSFPPTSATTLPFVGRAQELALLDQLLTDGPLVLLVAGEPGIGKSRLLQAGIERAQEQGWTVLTGGCHRRSGQDPLALLVADLVREGQASRAELSPLAEAEATALLAQLLPETADGDADLRQQVLERAAGVPLFLVSCVQALFTGHLTWNGASHVPWTLREAILQRVVALQKATQQVLRLAAVVGRRVPRTLLVAVAARADLAEEVGLEALEGCGRARLLGEAGEDAYQFTHDLIREVVLADLSTARRALLHRRVAEVLEATVPAPAVTVLAYHYAQSDEQERAILSLEWAGDAARTRYAQTEAASAYREVIARLETLGKRAQAAAVSEKLGMMLALQARYDEALLTLEQAIALAERLGDLEALAHLLSGRGLNAFALGEWQRARPDFERAATLVGSTGQFWYATYPPHGLGLLCLAEGKQEEATHYLEEALTLAQRNHDLQALCWVKAALAEWDLLTGRPEAARGRLAPLLDAPGLMVSYSREALALLAWAYLEVGEVDQAQALLGQVLRTARQARMRPTLVQALRVQALVLSKQERWQEAEPVLEEALTLCREMAAPYAEAKTLSTAGLVSQQKRELASARQRFEAALTILERLGERLYARYIEQLLGQGEHR